MATIAAQTISRTGLEAVYSAAASGGDNFVNTGKEFLHVKNGSAGDITVTIVTSATVDGLAVSDRAVVVTANEERFIGPFPTPYYNNASSQVALTYSGVTTLTLAVLNPGA